MQNTGYGGYPATAGYYSNPAGQPPPPPQGTPGTAANVVPAYGTGANNPYGSSYPQHVPTSDQYSSYTTTQPSYDTKNQQQAYMGYAQAANANVAPPNAASNAVPQPPPPASTGYGAATGSEAYGANTYYQSQPGSNPNPAQPPAPYQAQYGNAPQGPNAPNAQAVGWQPSGGPPPPPGPQSNYGSGPNGYSGGYAGNGMNRGIPPSGPNGPPPPGPGNFRGGPMGGGRNSGPGGFKAGPPPPGRNGGPPPPPPSAVGSGGGGGGGYMAQPTDVENDTIFISGMPLDVTEDQLSSHFGSIGIIKTDRSQKHKIWIYRDKVTGEGKGEATLTYEDPHTAKSAIQWFHGKELPGTGKILNVEFAQRKLPAGGDYKGGRGGRGGPPRGGGGGGGGDRGGGRNRDNGFVRQGDWRCPGCNNNNFSWRDQCNRCKAPRPGDVPVPSMDRRGGGGGPPMMGGGPGRRDGPPMGPHGMRGPPGDRPPMRGGNRPPMRGRGGGGPPRGGRGDFGPMRGPPMSDRRPKPY